MPLGTYVEPWVSVRDELRSLFQDNEATAGVIADAVISDAVYDQLLSEKGTRTGAVVLAQTYANYYALRVKDVTLSRSTRVAWVERQKHYAQLAQDIRTGKIAVGEVAGNGGVVVGAMTAGLLEAQYRELNTVWPDTERAATI